MNVFRFALFSVLVLAATAVRGQVVASIHAPPVFPGQPAFAQIDDPDGCFEFDEQRLKRNGNSVVVEIYVSDFVMTPCLPQHRTPVLLPLGTFEAGRYSVDVQFCGALPIFPCSTFALLTLDVGSAPRRSTIPATGVVALLLSFSGVLALAFTSRRPR